MLGPAPKRLIQSLFRGKDWIRIATEIELNYSLFDAFVILHGTDTMAYTSSALSFLLEDLGKTVVRSRTIHLARKTKERNRSSRERRYHCLNFEMMPWTTFSVLCLLPATTTSRVRLRHDSESRHSIAEAFDFVECCLFFNHTLFRGNRVSKASSNDFNAFSSPNFPPLVNGEYRNFECRRVHYG